MDKALSLISSGIDSPVATHIMVGKGLEVLCVHFNNWPFTDQRPKEKAVKQVKFLAKTFKRSIKLYIVMHGRHQAKFLKNTNRRYSCIFCRRMMFRIAEKIAEKEGCKFLITGENLGQVASQTLDNMAVIDTAIKMPILRPLLTNDKQETIDLGKKIGTYQTAIEKGVCCRAVPKNPVTKARDYITIREEERVDVKGLVDAAVEDAEVMIIEP